MSNLLSSTELKEKDPTLKKLSSYIFINCCAGSEGPISLIESILNKKLVENRLPPVEFVLADLHSHREAWAEIHQKSKHIHYITEPVDATNTTVDYLSLIGRTEQNYKDHKKPKECRLFTMSFHHFRDEDARRVLRSTINGADAFVSVKGIECETIWT